MRCQNLFTTISIHAPAKGATLSFDDIRKHIISFQSTLPRRERPQTAPQGQAHSHFNPRSREGSDLAANGLLTSGLTISIHAPAKGATLQPFALLLGRCISIHAPAKGATHYATPAPVLAGFQSTLPRRERPVALSLISFSRSFQSTLPRRSDQHHRRAVRNTVDFNHAPRRSDDFRARLLPDTISIHAPAKGATDPNKPEDAAIPISIHAPAKGATLFRSYAPQTSAISIHAPAKGATSSGLYFSFALS